jgi:hypothetical protein
VVNLGPAPSGCGIRSSSVKTPRPPKRVARRCFHTLDLGHGVGRRISSDRRHPLKCFPQHEKFRCEDTQLRELIGNGWRDAGDAAGSTKRALAGVLTALQKLGTVLDAQERELATLRKENRRFDELRRLKS